MTKPCLLEDPMLGRRFCEGLDRQIHCKPAHGTSEIARGDCEACPFSLAEKVNWLMQRKGMVLSEAIKAVVNAAIPYPAGLEIVRQAVTDTRPAFPDLDLKPNEEKAALEGTKLEEDD